MLATALGRGPWCSIWWRGGWARGTLFELTSEDHKMLSTIGRPIAVLGFLLALGSLASCARAVPPSTAVQGGDSHRLWTEVDFARAVGARLREEYRGGFVILPRIARIDSQDTTPVNIDASRVARLSEALRDGAHAHYLDTVAVRDLERLKALPDSERYYFSLAAAPEVWRDSARIAVFSGEEQKEPGEVSMNIMRYLFVRDDTGWHFVKRVLVYAA